MLHFTSISPPPLHSTLLHPAQRTFVPGTAIFVTATVSTFLYLSILSCLAHHLNPTTATSTTTSTSQSRSLARSLIHCNLHHLLPSLQVLPRILTHSYDNHLFGFRQSVLTLKK